MLSGAFIKIQTGNILYKLDDYWNTELLPFSITEYISCKIAKNLGMDVQEVNYTDYKGFSACKIELFTGGLLPLQGVSSTTFDTPNIPNKSISNNRFELLLNIIGNKSFRNFYFNQENYIKRLLDLVIIDTLTLNSDRHFGNIALIENNGIVELSPIYDLASTFFISEFFSNQECRLNKFKYQYRVNGRKLTINKFYNMYKEFLDNYKEYIEDKLNQADRLNIKEMVIPIRQIDLNTTAIRIQDKESYIKRCNEYLDFIEYIFYNTIEYTREVYGLGTKPKTGTQANNTGGDLIWGIKLWDM